MRKTKRLSYFLSILLLWLGVNFAYADEGGTLSSLSVVQDTLSAIPKCFHYKVMGVCFWLKCVAGICTVNTTPKVEHYLPDVVVSVFRSKTANPWDYAYTIVDPSAYQIGDTEIQNSLGFSMGHGNAQAATLHDNDTHFKEVDLIGNPAIRIFNTMKAFVLPSTAQPFVPYYLSMMDSYVWRSPFIETLMYPQNLMPGIHIVGTLMNNWGSVYPRTGFLIQPIDAKAAAVMAQRAADIATRTGQPHVYHPLSNDCGTACRASEAKENAPDTQWQMIYPHAENTCAVFGENDSTHKTPWNREATQKGNGNYAWVLWRHYKGCIQGEGHYIGSIDFGN